jgi:hypothetical protein
LFNALVLQPQFKKIRDLKDSLVELRSKSSQYKSFDGVVPKLNEQKDYILNLTNRFKLNLVSDEKTEQDFLNKISDVSKQADVRLEKNSAAEGIDGRQTWRILFTADFKTICRFLSMVEDLFRIEEIRLSRGANKGHQAELLISVMPLSATPLPAVTDGDDMFDMYDKMKGVLQRLEKKEDDLLSSANIGRDPFSLDTIFVPQKVVEKKVKKEEKSPQLSIDSICWDPDMPVVLIGGRAFREGETVDGIFIEKINEANIIVQWNSKKYTVQAGKREDK